MTNLTNSQTEERCVGNRHAPLSCSTHNRLLSICLSICRNAERCAAEFEDEHGKFRCGNERKAVRHRYDNGDGPFPPSTFGNHPFVPPSPPEPTGERGPVCGNAECAVSTGEHDGPTFGRGRLDNSGYWEIPCDPCARAYEQRPAKPGTFNGAAWPFPPTPVAADHVSGQEPTTIRSGERCCGRFPHEGSCTATVCRNCGAEIEHYTQHHIRGMDPFEGYYCKPACICTIHCNRGCNPDCKPCRGKSPLATPPTSGQERHAHAYCHCGRLFSLGGRCDFCESNQCGECVSLLGAARASEEGR